MIDTRKPAANQDGDPLADGPNANEAASGPGEEISVDALLRGEAEAGREAGLRNEVAELKDRLLRAMADTENVRRRGEREKAEATLYAASNFARDLLSVADNMARALEAMPETQREKADEATRNLLAGIDLTYRELMQVFGGPGGATGLSHRRAGVASGAGRCRQGRPASGAGPK
jgi:molecular chaperone GrpE